jgi:hypothetical protein
MHRRREMKASYIIGKWKMYAACCVKPPETYQSWQQTCRTIIYSSLSIIIIHPPDFCYTFESVVFLFFSHTLRI